MHTTPSSRRTPARWALILLAVAVSLSGCTAGKAERALERAAMAEAQLLVDDASRQYRARMVQSLATTSPGQSLTACSMERDAVADNAEISPHGRADGRVGYTSLKLRNAGNAGPAWVLAWLSEHNNAPADGLTSRVEVVDTPRGKTATALQPLVMEPMCMRCHGRPEDIHADVAHKLKERYPNDAAIGYKLGELRGAIWAQVAVGP